MIGDIRHPALLDLSLATIPDRSSIEAAHRRRHRIANLSQFRGPTDLQQVFANDCRAVESFILATLWSLLLERLQGLLQLVYQTRRQDAQLPKELISPLLERRTVSVDLDLGPIFLSKCAKFTG